MVEIQLRYILFEILVDNDNDSRGWKWFNFSKFLEFHYGIDFKIYSIVYYLVLQNKFTFRDDPINLTYFIGKSR